METVSFNVPSISCSNCSSKIQDAVNALEGVDNVTVDLKTQTVQVEFDPDNVKPQEIKREIVSMGYEVV